MNGQILSVKINKYLYIGTGEQNSLVPSSLSRSQAKRAAEKKGPKAKEKNTAQVKATTVTPLPCGDRRRRRAAKRRSRPHRSSPRSRTWIYRDVDRYGQKLVCHRRTLAAVSSRHRRGFRSAAPPPGRPLCSGSTGALHFVFF